MAIIILCLWSQSPKHRACDLHLRSTIMITIVTGATPWSPSLHRGRLSNYCFYDNDATIEIKVSRRWRWWSRRCFEDGDHKHKMIMAISYHLYWLHVMFIFYASYLALIDGSIIRWSLTKLSRSVLPEYAPLRKFFVLRHHVMMGCDRLYVQIQWVQNSCTRRILRLNLTRLAYNRYGLGTRRPKGRAWII